MTLACPDPSPSPDLHLMGPRSVGLGVCEQGLLNNKSINQYAWQTMKGPLYSSVKAVAMVE